MSEETKKTAPAAEAEQRAASFSSTSRASMSRSLPSMMPAISRNWRRTSTTMDWAAFCTALMVKAEKTKVSMAPMNSPTSIKGLVRDRSRASGVFSWTMLT